VITLTAADFCLLADDNPMDTAQEIKSFRDSLEDLALVICVHVSGTIARRPLNDAKEALLLFFGKDRARPHVEALRYISDTTGGQLVHARPDRPACTDALDRICEDLLATCQWYFR
jgi:hypothetical protein